MSLTNPSLCDTHELEMNASARAEFSRLLQGNYEKFDKAFSYLLVIEWVAAVLAALIFSPLAWQVSTSHLHLHVWLAISMGAMNVILPCWLAYRFPGNRVTRLTIASSLSLFSVLLIHLTAGRIETHFHVFVTFAILGAYRDRSIYIPPLAIMTAHHLIFGAWWPQAVFGVETFQVFRPFEHVFWLSLEAMGMCYIIQENLRQWQHNANLQQQLSDERDQLESRIEYRTKQLDSLQRFREEILNSIDASICILDSQGRIVFVNYPWTEFAKQVGQSEHCGVGSGYVQECGIAQLGSPEFAAIISHNIHRISVGEIDEFRSEYSMQDKDQIVRHFRLSLTPVVLEGELGVAIVQIDVTHLKRAERRASSLARLLLESPDEVVIASTDDHKLIEFNDIASINTGYSRNELLHKPLVDLVEASHRELFLKHLNSAMMSGTGVIRFESTVVRKDGSCYPCSISLHKTVFEESDVWVLFIGDLTERQELETRLQQARKLESLGTLAAGIAHEINTPMQCVVGNFEFLRKSYDRLISVTDRIMELLDNPPTDWQHTLVELRQARKSSKYDYLRKQTPLAIQEAAESSRRIVSIVRAMKSMSHPGTDGTVDTDLHELIQNASIISRNRWKSVADLVFNFSPEVPLIKSFPAELNQVFTNLFVNATDAIAEKIGPNPKQRGRITVDTKLASDRVVIQVSDTGVGIPQHLLQRIFDPFFTTKSIGKGTGQGLAITHAVIVNKHKGYIAVSSEVGQGAVFTIELPIDATLQEADCSLSNIAVDPPAYSASLVMAQN